MTYSKGRVIHDADSHTMETADWLQPYLQGEHREKLSSLYSQSPAGQHIVKLIDQAKARKHDPEAQAAAAENPVAGPKGWLGYGAFDTDERIKALDWLGFGSQLVFPTFGLSAITKATDEETMYVAAQALNRAQCAFCAVDPRLIAVAYVPLDNPLRAMAELDAALEIGAGAVMISAAPAGDRSPGHPDLDPFWARLQERNVPFMLHIGPGTRTQPKPFHNNGRPRAPDLHGGGENLRFADYLCLWYAPQEFLTAMIYDGVFERFPALRGGVIESGAGWAPDFLRQLDYAYASFKKTDPYLQTLSLKPSEQIRRAVKFTPFPSEDVGRMIRDAGADLFMFSSDYPHPEGTPDPIGRFERTLGGLEEAELDAFYRRNYEVMMGMEAAAAATIAAE
jgi:predicted TIM-barrel fold metal-dependent hydrolase